MLIQKEISAASSLMPIAEANLAIPQRLTSVVNNLRDHKLIQEHKP